MNEPEARQHLDAFFAAALGCEPGLFQAPGIALRLLPGRSPFSLFRKCVLILHAPSAPAGQRACVLAAHPALLEALAPLLPALAVEGILEEATAAQLSRLVRATFSPAILLPEGEHLLARCVSAETFRPAQNDFLRLVAPLDAQRLEHLPVLTRYAGGVYAICDAQGQVMSRAGIRTESPFVWEIGVRTEREEMRGRGLAKAVVSAATGAVLAAGRVPLYIHSATNLASQQVALAVGYQPYADERLWAVLE